VRISNIAILAAVSLAVSVPPAFAQGSRPQATTAGLPKSVRVVEAATPLRTGPGVTYPIVVTEAAGTVLEVTGRDGDWYRITLRPDMVVDPNAPRTVYVLARLVSSTMGSIPNPQGIPTSQTPQPPPPQAQSEALLAGHAILEYDASKWRRSTVEGEPDSFQLTNSTGDLFVKVVTSRFQVSLDKIPDVELASTQKADPKARIIDRGFEKVNGVRMGSFQVLATVSGVECWYYTRYYSDANGTIKVIGYTAADLIQQAGPVFDKVVDGLHIVR
jgi:hypothetical protein